MSRRDGNTISPIMGKVDNTANVVKELSDKLVREYCEDLDNIMVEISELLASNNFTDKHLENFILDLANILYFTSSAQEDLGIKEDTCRAIRQELYNKTRDSIKGTVADKNAQAENAVKEETIVLSVYSRAYKKVKLRMEAGYEMLASLKKVMNRRVSELELSNSKYIGGCGDVD